MRLPVAQRQLVDVLNIGKIGRRCTYISHRQLHALRQYLLHAQTVTHRARDFHIKVVGVDDAANRSSGSPSIRRVFNIAVQNRRGSIERCIVNPAKDEIALNPLIGDAIAAAQNGSLLAG